MEIVDVDAKSLPGCLVGLIGIVLVVGGIAISGISVLGVILEYDPEQAGIAFIPILIGFVVASVGFLLCLVSWALIRASKASRANRE